MFVQSTMLCYAWIRWILCSMLTCHLPQSSIPGMAQEDEKWEIKNRARRMNNHTIIMISALPLFYILVRSRWYGKKRQALTIIHQIYILIIHIQKHPKTCSFPSDGNAQNGLRQTIHSLGSIFARPSMK